MAANRDVACTNLLLKLLATHLTGLTKQLAYRKLMSQMSLMEFTNAVAGAVASGLVLELARGDSPLLRLRDKPIPSSGKAG